MACGTFNLRTDFLTGADTGGTWTVTAGMFTGTPLSGDDPPVTISTDIPLGTSTTFQYSGLDCDGNTVTADVTLFNMDLGSVTTASASYCDDDLPIAVFLELSGTLGAQGTVTWSGPDITNPGFSGSGTSFAFDPGASGIGTFNVTATISPNVPGGYSDLACCDPITANYTVTVTEAFNPGTGGLFAGC